MALPRLARDVIDLTDIDNCVYKTETAFAP